MIFHSIRLSNNRGLGSSEFDKLDITTSYRVTGSNDRPLSIVEGEYRWLQSQQYGTVVTTREWQGVANLDSLKKYTLEETKALTRI